MASVQMLPDEYLTGAGAVEGLESEVIKNDNPGWNCSAPQIADMQFFLVAAC